MDLISNALTKLRNASLVKNREVRVRKSKSVTAILDILKTECFITDYKTEGNEEVVTLKYFKDRAAIAQLKRISKPGQRIYIRASELKPVFRGRGIGIISTSKGLMTIDQAQEKGLGGEYICQIW